MVDFGNTFKKQLRLREDMTQAQLAQKTGINKNLLSVLMRQV